VIVVSLASFTSVQDIETGGSLRGLALTPAGLWLYAADQQLNLIDVIDLNEEKPTFRSVAATIESSRDPVDVEVSPDGLYAYSIVRDEGQLVATAIGTGPIIKTLSRRSGPVGAAVVIAGSGFGGGEVVRVDFNGLTVGPRSLTGTSVVCNVPSGATSGPVRVEWWEGGEAPRRFSNSVFFEVLGPTPPSGGMRLGAIAAPATPISEAMAISPLGDLAVVGHESGAVSFLDLDPSSPSYNQFIGTVKPLDYEVTDIAITPDGTKAIVISSQTNLVPVINVNRNSKNFGKAVGQVTDSLGFQEPGIVRIDPSGEFALVYDQGTDNIYFIDLVEGSSTQYESFRSVSKPAVTDIQISPTAKFASVLESAVPGYWSLITDPFHPSYGLLTGNMPLSGTPPPIPVSASFYPSGDTVLVYAVQQVGPSERLVWAFDVSTPENPHSAPSGAPELPSNSRYAGEQLRISPRGDRYILNVTDSGFHYYGREETPWEGLGSEFTFANRSRLRWDFVPDASRFYVASDFLDSVLVYDFSTAQIISSLSGNEQIGVVNELLPAPLRVQVSTMSGLSVAGVSVRFRSITPGGGNFAVGDVFIPEVVVATDDDGVASVDFVLGPALGSQFVEVTAQGLAGSPLTFLSNAEENPSTLPLRVAQVLPFGGATNVSVTTALQVTFSRAVDALSIGGSSLYVHEQGNSTPLAVVYGFADGDRRVSLTPVNPLAYGTSYVIEATAGIADSDGGPLQNPRSSTFSTQAPPPPTIASIAPPAGTAGITVVISGAGFDPVASGNTVLFNSVAATPATGGVDHLNVIVPNTAASGLVRVVVGADTSNAVSFNVLVPSTSTADDVVATANTGSGTKSITVTPDGALAYAVSPESDIVIPIGVDSLKTYPGIPVGDEPVAIAMHPEGTFAYVPNFGSASVSIIGTDPDAVGFNTVVQTLIVGAHPVDVAVLPDGRRVLVANSGSNNLSVLDADSSSATHHTVVATVQTGSSTRTVTVSPDGTRVFVGTDTDILVLEALGYSVVATVQTGSSTKQVTVSPDGTLLFVLTSADELLIVDVEPASPTENSVVATVQTGSGTKTVTVSPDGGLLYLVQEDSDEVIVVSVETLGSAGVIEERATFPPKNVAVAFVDTIPTGDDPQSLAFDPTGSGRFIVTTAGDRSITLFGKESPVIPADITLFPQILVVLSENDLQWWQFRYIRAWIELPTGYDPRHIEVPSIRVNDVVAPVPGYSKITDIDGDGIEELHVKFDRLDFQRALPIGWVVPVLVAGSVDGQQFLGETKIVTIRPIITHPRGGDFVPPGQIVRIKWQSPLGFAADAVDVRWSPDDGRTWQLIAGGIQNVGYCDWRTPEIHCDSARVLVTLFKNGQEIGTGMSDEPFSISAPLAVKLASFGGTIEDGDAVLTWRTNSEAGTTGFHVLRAEAVEGSYERITPTEVPAVGGSEGASYQYRDPSIQPNRRYFFKLQEVTADGAGGESEAFELVSSLSFELEQNAPNPFNPSTVIRFSVAEDVHVRLIVYDVAGRTVRTLVDEVRRPDLYKLVWDGTNDAGQTVASGVYFYRVTAGKFVKSRKMLLLK